MSETNTKMNPLIGIAAVAIIIFSAVGVGVMTGIIPSSRSANDVGTSTETKAAPAPEAKATAATVHKPATPETHKRTSGAEPRKQAAQVAVNQAPPVGTSAPARICAECGVIDTIDVVDKKGSGSGLGAVGGAVVGGLLGNQFGAGRGKTAVTVLGAVGGAVAGNEVEKRVKSTKEYKITVHMDDGSTRSFTFDSAPAYAVGEKVKVIDGKLVKE